ncbi:MAG: group II intron reverse transcriptase/maturase, partial [Solirubrobacteraceae bacterium]
SADDFLVCVAGGKEHAEALKAEVEQVIAPLGLKLSPEKTRVVSIDEGQGQAGARCRRCRRSVSPTRPPNRLCGIPRNRLYVP